MLNRKIVKCVFGLVVCCGVIITGIFWTRQLKTVDVLNEPSKNVIVLQKPKIETSSVSLLMVGDNLIHSSVYKSGLQYDGSYNFDHLFENIKEDVNAADIAIINQETIFIEDDSKYSSYPMFGSPTEIGNAAVKAGFDIIAHATNHTMDKGTQGVLDSIAFWENNYPDITYLGIHDNENDSDIEYVEKNNIKFAFVNYTYGLNGLESRLNGQEYMVDLLTNKDIEETLKEAEKNAELTVAILHVGTEYVYEPTTYARQQVERFIDNGADIVLCAHPHVVEPYEVLTTSNGNIGLVYYSLGNFTSAQDEIPRILGGMAKINITKTEDRFCSTIEISDYTMEPLVTHQEFKYYTTYKLEDYTDDLCKKHTLYRTRQSFTCDSLKSLFDEIVGERNKQVLVRECKKKQPTITIEQEPIAKEKE